MSTTTTTDTKAHTAPATTDPNAPANGKPQAPVYTADHPEYPKLMYNVKTRTTAPAKDKDAEGKLQGEGYSEDPYPPLPPPTMTPQDMQQLETLLHKQLSDIAESTAPAATAAAPPPKPVPGAEPYPGATGGKDSSSSSSGTSGSTGQGTATGASGKPPAKQP